MQIQGSKIGVKVEVGWLEHVTSFGVLPLTRTARIPLVICSLLCGCLEIWLWICLRLYLQVTT